MHFPNIEDIPTSTVKKLILSQSACRCCFHAKCQYNSQNYKEKLRKGNYIVNSAQSYTCPSHSSVLRQTLDYPWEFPNIDFKIYKPTLQKPGNRFYSQAKISPIFLSKILQTPFLGSRSKGTKKQREKCSGRWKGITVTLSLYTLLLALFYGF